MFFKKKYLPYINNMKKALVLGAGGFIGSHLVKRLKKEGYFVTGVDLKYPSFSDSKADSFIVGDLIDFNFCKSFINDSYDECYQLAALMGGAGYIFTGNNDADIIYNSAQINLNVAKLCTEHKIKVFFSSSACVYKEDPNNPNCIEDSAYPAMPDSIYGWEKLFSENLYLSFHKNHQLDCKIARFHNIFGEEGTFEGGKEKAPAAICRKVILCPDHGEIEIWGNGQQTRSFLYIEECIEGIRRLMKSDFIGPVNIGSDEMVTITELVHSAIILSGKTITISYVPGPTGVNGRNSDNTLIKEKLNWEPYCPLSLGLYTTYAWIEQQLKNR